jgi:hypothetical protein
MLSVAELSVQRDRERECRTHSGTRKCICKDRTVTTVDPGFHTAPVNAAMVARRRGRYGTERDRATIIGLREVTDQEP